MRITALGLCLISVLGCNRARTANGAFGFEEDDPDRAPSGLMFASSGQGRPGSWIVRRVPGAAGGKAVLTQADLDPVKKRYLFAVTRDPAAADVSVSARCKLLAGMVDQACGVVVRYQDENNHYLARVDALDGDLRMYAVKDGKRTSFATFTGQIALGIWHELRVEAQGSRFVVWLDGRAVIDAHDSTHPGPGRAGIWTKSDVVAHFDELVVRPLRK